jgi:hypothetical protein
VSNLVLYTYRSGSTLLADLLSYSQGTINLGEGLSSLVRHYNYNLPEHRQTDLYKAFTTHMSGRYYNMGTKGSDHIGFFRAKAERINILKNSNEQWTIKDTLEKLSLELSFIEHCIDNNINIYMTHRRNITEQFISKINARYRQEISDLKTKDHTKADFIYTNQDTFATYDEMKVPFSWLHMYVNVFLGQLFMWRTVYDRYRDYIQVVSYEDNIKPLKLSKFGISDEHIRHYNQEQTHLVPTPFNSKNLVVADKLPPSINSAWEQSLYLVAKHQYLVEI